ncbi:hypothetical protein NQZ68_024841, partial [Dissostichus eleginoides]
RHYTAASAEVPAGSSGVSGFLWAVEYAMKKLLMREPLIKHAMFLDVQQRVECGMEDALYFVD